MKLFDIGDRVFLAGDFCFNSTPYRFRRISIYIKKDKMNIFKTSRQRVILLIVIEMRVSSTQLSIHQTQIHTGKRDGKLSFTLAGPSQATGTDEAVVSV